MAYGAGKKEREKKKRKKEWKNEKKKKNKRFQQNTSIIQCASQVNLFSKSFNIFNY